MSSVLNACPLQSDAQGEHLPSAAMLRLIQPSLCLQMACRQIVYCLVSNAEK